ncbi:hypothetical protein Q1695_010721 [Nippostrongylus brasiliensis]|nr:hypothetical protein Q1695_010721 [Nippostrongylus brasiliensis]
MPEASFHVFEAVVAWHVGHVKHGHISWSLVAERQTLNDLSASRVHQARRGVDFSSSDGCTLIPAAAVRVLHQICFAERTENNMVIVK